MTPVRLLPVGAMFTVNAYDIYCRTIHDDPYTCREIRVGETFTVVSNDTIDWALVVESSTGRCSYLCVAWWGEVRNMRIV